MSGGLLAEDRVHRRCARADHGLELVPVDLLGNDRGLVPDKVGDLLDGYSVVAHDGHERVPELSGCPVVAESGRLGDAAERAADVGSVERGADACAEDEIVGLPRFAGFEALRGLASVVLLERPGDVVGDLQGAAGLLGLGVAVFAHRAPHVDGELLVLEANLGDRTPPLGLGHPRDHVFPVQRAGFLGTHALTWIKSRIDALIEDIKTQLEGEEYSVLLNQPEPEPYQAPPAGEVSERR
jgi:hypothetical protein